MSRRYGADVHRRGVDLDLNIASYPRDMIRMGSLDWPDAQF